MKLSAGMPRATAAHARLSCVPIIWRDRAIRNEWLRVSVNPSADTGLAAPDVFYFGNLVGKTTASPPGRPTALRLSPLDLLAVRRSLASGPTDVANSADLNHDGRVDALDLATARSNLLRVLQPIDSGAALAPA